jgi:hypothetical protein
MAYATRLNNLSGISSRDAFEINLEFNLLRAELDNLRTQYAVVLAKLDADAGVTDTNYAALGVLAAKQFVA